MESIEEYSKCGKLMGGERDHRLEHRNKKREVDDSTSLNHAEDGT